MSATDNSLPSLLAGYQGDLTLTAPPFIAPPTSDFWSHLGSTIGALDTAAIQAYEVTQSGGKLTALTPSGAPSVVPTSTVGSIGGVPHLLVIGAIVVAGIWAFSRKRG